MHFTWIRPRGTTFWLLLACATLTACGSRSEAIWSALELAWGKQATELSGPLNPNFQYLRVMVAGRLTALVLGTVDEDPQGPIESWFSPSKEVIRLQNGRLVGASGLHTEWREVRMPAMEPWSALARMEAPRVWTRVRDVMPGYRYGVSDQLSLQRIRPPADSLLRGVSPAALTWFEEVHIPRSAGETPLPTARYAVDFSGGRERVVYAEQCLSHELCFSWQQWPVPRHLAVKQ